MGRFAESGKSARAPRVARPSQEYKRPVGANEDGAPTVRNIIPWKNMEAELAKRLAAKAARGELDDQYADAQAVAFAAEERKARLSQPPAEEIEKAPDSGVRSSQKALAPDSFEATPHRPLTYSVYTVSELDQARPSPRLSMAAIAAPASGSTPPAPMPSKWSDVWRSGLALLRAWWGCVRAPKPRPRVLDVCRVPAVAFFADLRSAVRALPWRSIGWVAAVVGGAIFLALLAVVTVAELTDDLKPAQTTTKAEKKYEAPNAAAEAAAASGMAAVTPPIEIDDEPPNPPAATSPSVKKAAPAAKPPASKSKAPAKKPKGPDIFIP